MTTTTRTTGIVRTWHAMGFLLAWVFLASVAAAQEITVQVDAAAPIHVTAADIAGMPHQKVSVEMHGKAITFEAVPLRLILEKAA